MKDNNEIKYQGEPLSEKNKIVRALQIGERIKEIGTKRNFFQKMPIVPKNMLHSSIKNTEPKIIYVRRLAAAFEED
jgi:hypothetical protein